MSAQPKETLTSLVTYDVTEAQIAATRARYAALTCDTPAGYEEVRLAIATVRDTRVAVEKRRVELKADALAYGKLVDSEAKRFTGMLLSIEEPLKAKKAVVDDEKERVKREAEAAKLKAIEEEIARNRAAQEAEARAVREAEEKRLAEERKALDAERVKLAAAQAELDARRREDEARAAATRKLEQDRIDAAAREERARIDAERAKLDAERRAHEEKQRAEREALETERRRVAAEREKAERAEFERQAKLQAEEAAEQKRVEAARRAAELAALAPDVEKLAAFAAAIRALEGPVLTSEDLQEVVENAIGDIQGVAFDVESAVTRHRG